MKRLAAIGCVTLLGWIVVLVAALSSERLAALPVALAMGAWAGRIEQGTRAAALRQAGSWVVWLFVGAALGAASIPRWAADGHPIALVGLVAFSSFVGALAASPMDDRKEARVARVVARTVSLAVFATGYRAGNAYAGLILGAFAYAATLDRLTRPDKY